MKAAARARLPVLRLAVLGFTVLGLAGAWAQERSQAEPDPRLGQRIYRHGILSSGEPIRGTIHGDIPVAGEAFACASCHRRSGFGTSEGGAYVPPVTAPALFQQVRPDRGELFRELYQEVQTKPVMARVRDPRLRDAYTTSSLALLLRRGIDPAGRSVDPLMPHYELGDEDMAHLIAYLRTLAASSSPGVDDTTIHFSTIVTDGVDPRQSQAMLDVMRAYVERKNADTEGLLARPDHSLWHRADFLDAYRKWELHVWRLAGAPETWGDQLRDHYQERPVFAVLGGLGHGTWQPVHQFCETFEIPCLFPNAEVPTVSQPGDYALYFSRGLTGEAQALAQHLQPLFERDTTPTRVVQVHRQGRPGAAAARALAEKLGDSLTEDRVLEAASAPRLPGLAGSTVLVLWLELGDLAVLRNLASSDQIRRIYLSYALLREASPETIQASIPGALHSKVRLTWRYALPGHEAPRTFRLRAWMRSRRIAVTHERLQLNTYFAFSVADHALSHLLESFSRDYFIESVEHETENALNPGVFPRLSLGPGQRFASKGSYIVQLTTDPIGFEAVSPWLVP